MGNQDRRARRKEKRASQQKRRLVDKSEFYNAMLSSTSKYEKLKADALRRYPRLAGIAEFDPAEKPVDRDLLDAHGLRDYEVIPISLVDQDGYGESDDNPDGGAIFLVHGPDGVARAFMKLKRRPLEDPGMLMALFLHELGHVDDFSRGAHIRAGEPIDARAVELYAHHFACRAMAKLNLKFQLGWYLSGAMEQFLASPVASIRLSAQDFMASPEFARWVAQAGPFAMPSGEEKKAAQSRWHRSMTTSLAKAGII